MIRTIRNNPLLYFLFFVFCLNQRTISQNNKIDSIYKMLPCIKPELNRIGNDSIGLKFFYQQLRLLKNDSSERVSIVHIGDSHIQADNFLER